MKLAVLGSPTLQRFTEGILEKGLRANDCEVVPSLSEADFAIIQVHGAPAAREADVKILEDLLVPSKLSPTRAAVVLLHRPDEIRDSLPQFGEILKSLPPHVGVAMLGDLLIDDPFYRDTQRELRVIPHGFFDLDGEPLDEPVVVGTHTTWGEMRSVERVLLLLQAISDGASGRCTVGYLGGVPAESVSRDVVTELLQRLEMEDRFTLKEIAVDHWREQLSAATPNTIFLHHGKALSGFDVTFNTQLYHYNDQVRLGESSGSLHASAGIPVIFEMNGSERLEELKVIKVPYADREKVGSADMNTAAGQIVRVIETGEYREMLSHNRRMSQVWNSRKVARLYVEFLESLAKRDSSATPSMTHDMQ
jgi:hypothetical protein